MRAQIVNIFLGLWVMAAPALLGYGPAAADNGHIMGPVIVTFAAVAIFECTRPVRKWNYLCGIWLLLAPWILGYEADWAIISDMVAGIAVIIFASVKGTVTSSFGGGWSSLWKSNPEHKKI